MELKVKHKSTNKIHSMIYNHWIHEIVNKGEAKDYIILEYPDLSQLIVIHPDGKREKSKILDTKIIKEQVDKYPNAYDLIKIDAKEQIAKDLKYSNDLKNNNIKNVNGIIHNQNKKKTSKNKINFKKILNYLWTILLAIGLILGLITDGFGLFDILKKKKSRTINTISTDTQIQKDQNILKNDSLDNNFKDSITK